MNATVIGIVGGGALGAIHAAKLASSAHVKRPVHLLTRQSALAEAARAAGIGVAMAGGTAQRFDETGIHVFGNDAIASIAGSCDLVLVLARSQESAYAVRQAGALLSPNGRAIMLQNGLSGWDALRTSGIPYVAGVTFTGGHRVGPADFVCSHLADIVLGSDTNGSGAAARIRDLFEASGLPCRLGTDEASVIWRKLLITSVNWLCASVGVPAKDIIPLPQSRSFLLGLMRELLPIAAADGARLDWDQQVADLDYFFAEGKAAMGSAYEALRQGQPLEIVDICRTVLARAQRYGVVAQRTEVLLPLLEIQSQVFRKERDRWSQG